MMSIEEKLDQYINQLKGTIKKYLNLYPSPKVSLYNEDKIREEIKNLIINEKDFILTEAFINHIVYKALNFALLKYEDTICYVFQSLNISNEDILIINGYLGTMFYNNEYLNYSNIITKEEEKLFKTIRLYQRIVYGCPLITKKDKNLSLDILLVLASYVYINKLSTGDLIKLFDDYVANILDRLDDIKLQLSLKYNDRTGKYECNRKELTNHILYRLKNNNKREREIR